MIRYLILSFCLISSAAHAQKQLVLLKGEDVLLRLYPGDEFIFKLENSRTIRRSYVNNLFDDAIVTHRDTIPFHKIERLYFRRTTRMNIIGGTLVFAGAALFLIDQINIVVVQGEKASLDDRVSAMSLSGIAIGLPLMLIKKKSQRLGYRYKLMTVKEGSSFYQPDPRGFISPYMDN